jgi:uncharacterized protein (DUF1778 family)
VRYVNRSESVPTNDDAAEGATLGSIELELTPDQFEMLTAAAAARELTLDQMVEQIVREFIATHPIIAQTRSTQ